MAVSAQQFFRISGIPASWTEVDVADALKSIDPAIIRDDQNPRLSLYPACSGLTKTGLLKLDNSLKLSESIQSGEISLELSVQGKNAIVDIDGHFYGLTPLNTPGNDVLADVVAVTGHGGHAFESWTSRETCTMWLNDFLPDDVKGIRIMSYGYNSSLIGETVDDDFLDYRRHLLQMLANARRSIQTRPIIFIGHGMGGILILQALLNNDVFNSTRAIFFFGVPRLGQHVESLLERIQESSRDGPSSRKRILTHLDERSNFLSTQREDITQLFHSLSDIEIISFYETMLTPMPENTLSGRSVSGGDQVKVVKRDSAQMFLPYEYRLPIGRNHSDMVKFHLKVDQTYQIVITHMCRCVDKIAEKKKERDLTLTKELRECLKSLKVSDHESYRDKHFQKRYGETCSWIFSNQRYRYWLENDDRPILWIHGGPGFGKSVLSSVLSKELCHDKNTSFDKEYSVAYFFCDDNHQLLKTSDALLTNLLAQLLKQDPNALIHFAEEPIYNTNKGKTVWGIEMLWRVFGRIVKDENLKPMCVIIDALDGCEEKARTYFLDELRGLFHGSHLNSIRNRIKIAITSRPQIPIQTYFSDAVEIPLDSNNLDDIAEYVHASVLKLEKRKFPAGLRQEIQDALIEGSNGMFLWVDLVLYDLQKSTKTAPYFIRRKLEALPKTLPGLYTRILLAIKQDDLELVNNVLQWVTWAEQPLTLQELTMAIAIQPGQTSISALSEMMELDLEYVLHSILGAIIKIQDKVVYLVHQSAKDFLKDVNPTINKRFSLQSDVSNLYITMSCLTYLSFDDIKIPSLESDTCLDFETGFTKHKFFKYSSYYWPDHMRQLDNELQETSLLKTAFLRLAESKQQLDQAYQSYCYERGFKSDISDPLSIAAFFGFTVFVQYLLVEGADVDAGGGFYGNALQVAIQNGNDDVVRYLVERGADVNPQGGYYGNELLEARE